MIISQLMSILDTIKGTFGDLNVVIHYDPRQSESLIKDPDGINIDDLKTLQIGEDNASVMLMNMYSWMDEYNGCRGEAYYNPETKQYEGRIIPPESIEGFNTTFVAPDKYKITEIFRYAVDEYNDFMGNAKITKTMEAVNGILEESEDQDLDYGELGEEETNNDSSNDEDDYGEI